MIVPYAVEAFTPDERAILEHHFTNLDGPVFALTNLPEVVKGALFARYSRTKKSLRRLFLDEFAEDVGATGELTRAGEEVFERVPRVKAAAASCRFPFDTWSDPREPCRIGGRPRSRLGGRQRD